MARRVAGSATIERAGVEAAREAAARVVARMKRSSAFDDRSGALRRSFRVGRSGVFRDGVAYCVVEAGKGLGRYPWALEYGFWAGRLDVDRSFLAPALEAEAAPARRSFAAAVRKAAAPAAKSALRTAAGSGGGARQRSSTVWFV